LVFVCIVLRQTPTGVAAMDRGAVFRAGATRRESGVSSPERDSGARSGVGGDTTSAGATGGTERMAVATGMAGVAYPVPNGHVSVQLTQGL
jgi:hypothetical protein